MPTLYNQYIYRDGAWRQTGTSSDSVTYQLSLSEDTLTLTGSDGSTSSVSISGGGNEDIFVANYNVTSNADVLSAYNEGKIIFAIYNHVVYGLSSYTVGTDNPTNIFRFYAPDTGLKAKEVLCQLQNGTTTVWQNSLVTSSIGNINSNGDITTTTTIASGDRLVINDESASQLDNSSITFGTNSAQYLANNGTWQNIPTAPVTSVNSKTGAVNLTASDVGALPDDTEIPEKTSDLTNDSNFVSDANYVHTDNNFTDTLEAKLNGIAEGATVDDHKWNDVSLTKQISSYSGDGVYVPYIRTSTPTKPSNWVSAQFYPVSNSPTSNNIAKYDSSSMLSSTTPTAGDSSTKVATTAFVSDAVGTAISGVNSFEYEVVQSLPTTNIKDHTIYLVAKTGSTGDVYDEYLYINNAWEHIGSTDVDLSGYVPTTRKVNNKALSSDITLTASDVGALPDSTVIPAQTAKIWTGTCGTTNGTAAKVVTLDDATGFSLNDNTIIAVRFTYPDSRENYTTDTNITLNVNNTQDKIVYVLEGDSALNQLSKIIQWGGQDIVFFKYKYSHSGWVFMGSSRSTYTTYDLASKAVPNTRTVNGKALSSNITLTASDVGATDEKVKQIPLNGMNSGKGVLFSSGTGGDQITSTVYTSNKLMWNDYSTPSLTIYNSDRTKQGNLSYSHLYLGDNQSSYRSYLSTTTLTANRQHILPDKGGTVALTSDIPSATTTTPAMDGTAAVGTETTFAKGDHVHPSDTSKVSKSGDTMTGKLTLDGNNTGLIFKYSENSSATFDSSGFNGTADYNTPRLNFTSLKPNSADSSEHNVILRGIANPIEGNEAANKQYVDNKVSALIPSQTSNNGKFLTTNGTSMSWATVDALPSQTGNSGKFLTTNGTTASWETPQRLYMNSTDYEALIEVCNGDDWFGQINFRNKTTDKRSQIYYSDNTISLATDNINLYGSINASNHQINNVSAPTANTDAANKQYVDNSITTKQDKYTITTATISASGWSNAVYSALQTTYPAASYDIEVELNGDLVTSEQKDAWSAAQIVGSATGNTIKALGDVPAVDIPVIVKATPTTDTYMADVESLLASI